MITETGHISTFGGPHDHGVDADEGIAIYTAVSQRPEIFLSRQPVNTGGLARRLDPTKYYLAARFEYLLFGKTKRDAIIWLRANQVKVSATGLDGVARTFMAWPADWGPGIRKRIADLSPGLAEALHVDTDRGVVTIEIPQPGDA